MTRSPRGNRNRKIWTLTFQTNPLKQPMKMMLGSTQNKKSRLKAPEQRPTRMIQNHGLSPCPREMPVNKGHPPIRRNLLLTHAAAIASLDKKLGIILDFLAEHQTPETHILLTSDLGIALGEKGFHGHGGSEPWLDTVNVPLIWCHPTRESNSLRHHALVSDKDLTELLLGDPKSPHGLLEKCWDGPREPGNPSVVTSGTGKAVACRTNEWSLVVDSSGSARLFEFPMDRWEVNDLATHHPDKLQFLLSQTTNSAICGFLRNQPGGQPS